MTSTWTGLGSARRMRRTRGRKATTRPDNGRTLAWKHYHVESARFFYAYCLFSKARTSSAGDVKILIKIFTKCPADCAASQFSCVQCPRLILLHHPLSLRPKQGCLYFLLVRQWHSPAIQRLVLVLLKVCCLVLLLSPGPR